MARVGVPDKYHVALNGRGFLVRPRGYIKRDAQDFVSRFGTGAESMDDQALYKVLQQTDFSGGMFQKVLNRHNGDPTKVLTLSQLEWDRDLSVLKPTPNRTLMAAGGFGAPPTAQDNTKAIFTKMYKAKWYVANKLRLDVWDPNAATWTNLSTTLPGNASGIDVVANTLWITTSGSAFVQYTTGGGIVTDAAYGWGNLVAYEGQLITTGAPGTADGGKIWKKNPTVGGAPGATAIGDVGDANVTINKMKVFNHRVYIGKPDGLFAYDNSIISSILDYSNYIDGTNFQAMEVYGGYLWFSIRSDLYRYNGAVVERVQRFPAAINNMTVASGQLYVGLAATANGADIYRYTDQGFELYQSYSDLGVSGLAYVGATDAAGSTIDYLIAITPKASNVYFNYNVMQPLVGSGAAKNTTAFLETPEFDCDFPRIDKFLRSISVHTINLTALDSVKVEYRIHDGQTWGAYQNLGNITTTTGPKLSLFDAPTLPTTFRRIQFKFTLTRDTTTVDVSIRHWSAEYYLSPPYRREWQLTLLAMGQAAPQQLQLVDGSLETVTAEQLRESVYTARASVAPIGFEDIDFAKLNGSHTAAVTTLTVDDTSAFPAAGMVKIDDEIIKYTAKTATTFTGCTRGYFGTTAAIHATLAYVNCYYRVVVKKIPAESVVEPSSDTYGSESELQVLLEEA